MIERKNTKYPQIFIICIVILILLTACGSNKESSQSESKDSTAITETKNLKDNIFDLRNLTPGKVLELYIGSLIKGDAKAVNSVLSKRFLSTINDSKGYENIQPQKISNVEVRINEKKPSTDNEVFLMLSFTLDDEGEKPFFMSGKGEYLYFVKLVNENNCWKIDVLSTSP